MTVLETPVLIVGGGGCGLSASIFLSNLGVEHLLVERRDTTSHLPKAHYLNQRTMEIFRQHGVGDAIFEVGCPIEKFGKVRWLTSLGGDGPLDRKIIHAMDAFGGGSLRDTYEADSPVMASNYPQLRLEPLLKREAERRAPNSIRFGHEVESWEQDADGVRVTVHDLAADERYTIAARYLIAADGGRTFGPALGTEMAGPTEMLDMVSTHFSADLSRVLGRRVADHLVPQPRGQGLLGRGRDGADGPDVGTQVRGVGVPLRVPAQRPGAVRRGEDRPAPARPAEAARPRARGAQDQSLDPRPHRRPAVAVRADLPGRRLRAPPAARPPASDSTPASRTRTTLRGSSPRSYTATPPTRCWRATSPSACR